MILMPSERQFLHFCRESARLMTLYKIFFGQNKNAAGRLTAGLQDAVRGHAIKAVVLKN